MAILKNSSKFEDNKYLIKSINGNYANESGELTLEINGEATNAIVGVNVDNKTGILTFTKADQTTITVDTMLEKVVTNFRYDEGTTSLILTLEDGTEHSVPLSSLIKEFTGVDGTTITVSITGSNIGAEIKNGTVTETHLNEELKGKINGVDAKLEGKADKVHTHEATQVTETTEKKFVSDTEKTTWNEKASKSNKHQVVLSKDNWTGEVAPYRYSITINGMDENKNWEVTNSVTPLMTLEELEAFGKAKMICGTQSTNTVELVAYGEKPIIDINLLIVVRGD